MWKVNTLRSNEDNFYGADNEFRDKLDGTFDWDLQEPSDRAEKRKFKKYSEDDFEDWYEENYCDKESHEFNTLEEAKNFIIKLLFEDRFLDFAGTEGVIETADGDEFDIMWGEDDLRNYINTISGSDGFRAGSYDNYIKVDITGTN